MELRDEIYPIVKKQGWTEPTVLTLALRYIERKCIAQSFPEFLQLIADQENSGSEVS